MRVLTTPTSTSAPPRDDGLAAGYRRAGPYLAACNSLLGAVAGCTLLGYGLDRWMEHSVMWLAVVGAVFGMVAGFVSFFFQIARADRSAAAVRRRDAVANTSRRTS